MTASTEAASTADTTTTATDTSTATQATTSTDDQATPPADTSTTTDTADKADAEKADAATEVPEAYTFELPDGMALDEKLAEKASPVLKELALTNDQANKLAGVFAEYIAEQSAGAQEAFDNAYAERYQAEVAERLSTDLEALRADKEIGGARFDGVRHEVTTFLESAGTAEFKALVNSTGIANNPEFVRVLHRALHASPIDTGGAAGGHHSPARNAAASLWPDLPTKG